MRAKSRKVMRGAHKKVKVKDATPITLVILPAVLGSRLARLSRACRGEPCDVLTSTPQVRSRGAAGWLPGGTAISTISLRRLVHNGGWSFRHLAPTPYILFLEEILSPKYFFPRRPPPMITSRRVQSRRSRPLFTEGRRGERSGHPGQYGFLRGVCAKRHTGRGLRMGSRLDVGQFPE